MICGPGGSKSRLAKAAGAEPAGQMRDEKVQAVGARSTFPSQNVQSTPLSDHFWKLRCRKSARRCGAKHIPKSKCTKHLSVGPLLEVEMSKKCTPLWCEAHFEVKMYKTHHFWKFRCRKVHAVVAEAHFEVKMLKTLGVRTTFGGSDVPSLRFTTLHYTTLHYLPLHFITFHYTPLHYNYNYNYNYNYTTTLHYTPLHSTTLHYTQLHYTILHYTTLHYTALLYTTLHNTTTTTTQLHSTTLHYTRLHYTTLHYTTLHWMTLHHRQTDR